MSVMLAAALALVVLSECSVKDNSVGGARGVNTAYVYTPADATLPATGVLTAYWWVVDRIEADIAVLENTETQQTVERATAELPGGIREGHALTDDGDGALRIDGEETAARAARAAELFKKCVGGL